ncbi:hypothetical protein KR054_000209 [Drosophila jambulina]|nr:hypothetical protein KR054_000209 [Drosophila jambulina]
MSSGQGGSKHDGYSNSGILSEDEKDKLVYNLRQRNAVPTERQPAQSRLKRLQTTLKRLQEKEAPTKDIKKAEGNRMTRRFSMFARQAPPPANLPVRRQSTCSDTLPRSYREHPRAKDSVTKVSSPQNAWEKPTALLDASNRLQAGSSQSANQRLAQLRASLRQQQETAEPNNNDKSTAGVQETHTQPQNEVKNCDLTGISAFNCSTASEEEPESMDWEESIEEEQMDPPIQKQANGGKANEISDILFMRQANGEEELPTRLLDHTYFVLDTNILMHNIKFVEALTEVILPGTVGSMLYIPYVVIKELDKLKISSENNRDQFARQAIRYLNTKFDESLQIQAQSSLEEADHLIDVDSPDDSIINCCLQLKEQVPNMMLLTNDSNLRLKGKASDIQVSCRSDLLADYPDEFADLNG